MSADTQIEWFTPCKRHQFSSSLAEMGSCAECMVRRAAAAESQLVAEREVSRQLGAALEPFVRGLDSIDCETLPDMDAIAPYVTYEQADRARAVLEESQGNHQ